MGSSPRAFCTFSGSVLPLQQLLQAAAADVLAFEVDHIVGVIAEDAGGLILPKNDRGPFHVDLQGVLLLNAQVAAQLDGQHDPAQLVHLSHDTGRFHRV